MINLNLNGTEYQLPNQANEVKLATFEKMYNLMQTKGVGKLEVYLKIFALFGIPEHELDEMTEEDLVNLIKEFNQVTVPSGELAKTIEVNGRTYTAYDEEFKFKARDIVEIERAAIKGVTNFPSYILAVLFKDDRLTKVEHYVESHIKHKASLFAENLTTDVAIPYLAKVAEKTLKTIQNV